MSDHGSSTGDGRSESLSDWFVGVRGRVARTAGNSGLARALRRVAAEGDRLAGVVRDSWLYRWLTAEPEPDVVVIDLRETYTVGPFVRLLDRLLDRAGDWAEDSQAVAGVRAAGRVVAAAPLQAGGVLLSAVAGAALLANLASGSTSTPGLVASGVLLLLGAVATRDGRSWAELRETRAVRLLAAAFEPPEPPEPKEPAETRGSQERKESAGSSESPNARR
ncbi:MAG: hypothetical protein V5A46_04175 [Haloferacaceae archaeon]